MFIALAGPAGIGVLRINRGEVLIVFSFWAQRFKQIQEMAILDAQTIFSLLFHDMLLTVERDLSNANILGCWLAEACEITVLSK